VTFVRPFAQLRVANASSLAAAKPAAAPLRLHPVEIGARAPGTPWIAHIAAVDLDRDGRPVLVTGGFFLSAPYDGLGRITLWQRAER